jgi:hypothetical protein
MVVLLARRLPREHIRSWNRAQAQWNPLVLIATPGDVSNGNRSTIALAYDTSTRTFGLATEDLAGNIDLYTPDGKPIGMSTSTAEQALVFFRQEAKLEV